MKALRLTLTAAAVMLWSGMALAQGSYSFSNNAVNQNIPDANPSGLTLATNLTGMSGTISNITLSLNITNAAGSTAYNGDLYAYLVGPNGGYAVLLNRVGVGTGSAFGYNNTGFAVTFGIYGTSGDIHLYQTLGGGFNGAGQLTGTWSADGRAIDPQSTPSAFDPAGTALMDSFAGMDPNGTWYLFFADMAGGNTSEVMNWTLNIETVPEPSTWALMVVGALALLRFRHAFGRKA